MQLLICTRIYASLASIADFRAAVFTRILPLCYVVRNNSRRREQQTIYTSTPHCSFLYYYNLSSIVSRIEESIVNALGRCEYTYSSSQN